MIIDHIGMMVADSGASKEFYSKTLSPLGIGLVMEVEGWFGFGKEGKAEFWFGDHDPTRIRKPMHIAFVAENRQQVRDSNIKEKKWQKQ